LGVHIASSAVSALPLTDLDKQTPEVCMKAVKKNGISLAVVINRTPELCRVAKNGETQIKVGIDIGNEYGNSAEKTEG